MSTAGSRLFSEKLEMDMFCGGVFTDASSAKNHLAYK